jgi:membrane-associated phospholipid phosphatase
MIFGRMLKLLAVFVLFGSLFAAAETPNGPESIPSGCGEIIGRLPHDLSTVGHGIWAAPRNAIRPSNLKWELPVAAGTGLLIAYADLPASRRIQSPSFERDSVRGSNIGVGIELGTAGLMYFLGCHGHRSSYMANTGWTALEAMGLANGLNLIIKAGTNRQYAYKPNSQGEFWEGGKSFASGHAATSFAFAAVIAHRYPDKRWLKWTAYGLATGVTLARLGGKKHFLSDSVVGAALGYVTGTYLAEHSPGSQ